MSQTAIVVEDGVIQCEHGGKVVLKSSEAVHVIGGKKPLHDIDLVGAPIQGCPYYAPVGGNCTSVASITSAVTEENVSAGGMKYLLRVDGCKTDKGAALVLVDPGQTNSKVSVKSDGSAGSITQKELEDAKLDTKENIKKEKYRIHPLRKSNGNIRALRGARDFQVIKNYHHVAANQYTHDKIITKTDAYLYVTHDGETLEYKVVNRGDFFDPTIQQVQFIDPKGTIRKHIPFYKEEGKMEIIYANVKLSEDDRTNFEPSIITIGDPKNIHVQNHKNYSKSVKHEEKAIKKIFLSQKEAKRLNKAYLNIVIPLEDPIGEVEDLYNDYEFSYHRHYGMNKSLIDDIRAKNQYPYAIADMIDYLYVNNKEKNAYEEQNEALKEQYEKLLQLTREEMGEAIESHMDNSNLVPALDYEVATDYYDELTFIYASLFDGHYSFSFKGKTKKRILGRRGQASRNNNLVISGKKFSSLKNSNSKALAYLTLSVCFSPKYKNSRTPRLKEESEKFYYLLKNAKPLPLMNEKSLEEISDELEYQEDYKKICSGDDPLLDEFEQLDSLAKEIAFDPKKAKNKLYSKNNYGFDSLKVGSTREEIFYNKNLGNPKEVAKKIAKALANTDLANILKKYQAIQSFENEQEEHHFYHNLINLATMLMAPRAELDRETAELSIFNHDNAAIKELVSFITEKLNTLGQEKAEKLHEEPIKTHYLNALYRLISHAKLGKVSESFPERKEKGKLKIVFMPPSYVDKGREDNVTAFLTQFEQEVPKQEIKTEKPLDNNFDKELKIKTDSEKLYASLKQIDGVTSYLDKIDGTVADDMNKVDKTFDDMDKKLGDENLEGVKEFSKYKKLLASTQALSFFITAGKIAEYIQGKEKLKIHNLIGFVGDTLSTTHYIADLTKTATGHEVPKIKSISKSVQHMAQLDKIVSPSSFKVMVRFGLIGAIANSVNDMNSIDKSTNEELYIATNTKNALMIALMFTPAWIALGGIALTELVWFFLKDKIESSNVELYLYKSLLFNTSSHNKNRWFNDQEGVGYRACIFTETLAASNAKIEAEHFTNVNALREFIAQTYESEPQVIEAAMRNELSQLKSIVHGINLTIQGATMGILDFSGHMQTKVVNSARDRNIYHCFSYVTLSKRLAENFTHFIHLHNGVPLEEQKVFEADDENNVVYNTMFNDNASTMQALGHIDATEIIVATPEVALKYKVVYEYTKTPYGHENYKASVDEEMIYFHKLIIKELKTIAMTDNDYKLIQ
jgi:hypothetical protein